MADYLVLLRDLSALDPPLFVFGSVAEVALLDGKLDDRHGDLDVLIPRSELEMRLRQLDATGLAPSPLLRAAANLPLVCGSTRGELALELSLVDFDLTGNPYFVVRTDDGSVAISRPADLSSGLPRSSTELPFIR